MKPSAFLVGGVSGNLPIPDLVDIAEAQLDLPTGWRDISSRGMQDTSMGATPDKLDNCTFVGGNYERGCLIEGSISPPIPMWG